MKMDPVPQDRPSNKDLARGLNQVHECLESHKRENDKHFLKLGKELAGLKSGLGMDPGQKQTIATNTGRQSFIRTALATASSVGGLFLLYRATIAISPILWHALVAINHVILANKF